MNRAVAFLSLSPTWPRGRPCEAFGVPRLSSDASRPAHYCPFDVFVGLEAPPGSALIALSYWGPIDTQVRLATPPTSTRLLDTHDHIGSKNNRPEDSSTTRLEPNGAGWCIACRMNHGPITAERLRMVLDLDVADGKLRWKTGGAVPESVHYKGYIYSYVLGKPQGVHRLVWRIVHGEIPKGHMIDHINGVKSDNRPANLRIVDHTRNTWNASPKRGGGGIFGVYRYANSWGARIFINGKVVDLGRYPTKGGAAVAYAKASLRYRGLHSWIGSKALAKKVPAPQ